MSLTVRFMTHIKRNNSTKLPDQTTLNNGIALQCVLMDDTSLMNPTFKISYQSTAAKPIRLFNYCWCDEFGRYYHITEITSSQNFWYITCEDDVLASFKNYIGASSHYILRSASAGDQYIIDSAYITRSNAQTIKNVGNVYEGDSLIGSDPFAWSNGHSYVLGIVGNAYNSNYQFGSVVYYWMSDYELGAFINYLMNSVSAWSNIDTEAYSEAVQAALLNPVQYIVSAVALPFAKPASGGARVNNISFGYYNYTNAGFDIVVVGHDNIIKEQRVEFNLPKHPQAQARGLYMNSSAFTSYTLHLGPFGDIPLDPALLISDTKLQAYLAYDVTSGACRVIVKGDPSGNILYHGTVQVGVPINLSSANRDMIGMQTNLVNGILNTVGAAASAAPGVATGNLSGVTSVISAPISAVEDAARLKYPTVIGGGEAGSFLSFHDFESCYLLGEFYYAVTEKRDELGRALYDVRTINTLSGYILCSGADVPIPGTLEESIKVNEYLNTGFYYE